MADNENLLTKVNLNGTELIIGDAEARQQIENTQDQLQEAKPVIDNITTDLVGITIRVKNVENKVNSLITATYDAQSQTLSLTSKS